MRLPSSVMLGVVFSFRTSGVVRLLLFTMQVVSSYASIVLTTFQPSSPYKDGVWCRFVPVSDEVIFHDCNEGGSDPCWTPFSSCSLSERVLLMLVLNPVWEKATICEVSCETNFLSLNNMPDIVTVSVCGKVCFNGRVVSALLVKKVSLACRHSRFISVLF